MGYKYPPVDSDNYVPAIEVVRGMGLPSHRLDILLGKYGKLRNFIYKTNRGQRVVKKSERGEFEKTFHSFI
jgi:hypothetical protein